MSGRIDGVVLAAGRSTRMGRPKPTLLVEGETFLERAVRRLYAAGCARVCGVFNSEGAEAADGIDIDVVINPETDSEQIDSLNCALSQLEPSVAAVLVLPVDVPLVTAATCAAVVSTYRSTGAGVVVPVHGGVAGHPLLLARAVFEDVRSREWPEGVRSLILAHAEDMREVDVDDGGILIDIDTPADYRAHVGLT